MRKETKQAIHIFQKDARCFRLDIALVAAAALIYAWLGSRPLFRVSGTEVLVEAVAVFVIARVIHAESIPGDRQFWLTRPYDWRSLAAAKLLFIALFVLVPMVLAELAILTLGNAPIMPNLPGLLWSQVLLFGAALLVAALAALTTGTVVFVLSVLMIAILWTFMDPYFVRQPLLHGVGHLPWPGAIVWVREYAALLVAGLTGVFILIRQYRYRSTVFSRVASAAGIALSAAVFLWFPLSVALTVQTALSSSPTTGSPVRVSVEPLLKGKGLESIRGRDPEYRFLRVPVPLAIRGLGKDAEARIDGASLIFSWTGKSAWQPESPPGVNPRFSVEGLSVSDATVLMNEDFYHQMRSVPLAVSADVYLTLFGEAEVRSANLGQRPRNYQDGLQCFTDPLNLIYCRSFFRWPARLVYADSGRARYELGNTLISYSPFPADAGLDPPELRSGGALEANRLTVTTLKPLAHLRRKFEARGLKLSDFEGEHQP